MARGSPMTGHGRKSRLLSLLAVLAALALHRAIAEPEESEVDEEKPTPESVAMAATLIGAISFIMCLYYFTNWPDPDIKKYSWEIISMTISIFCAVLLFQSFNDIIEAYVIDKYGMGPYGTFVIDMLHMLVWFACLQGILAFFSGAMTVDFEKFKLRDEFEQKEELERREINLQCYAALMAHLAGFASINAWGSLQQLPVFAKSPILAQLAVFIAFAGQCGLQRITSHIRERYSMGDDGELDPFEEMWDDEVEEAENDIMSLTLSFMSINAWRFAIIGCMPNNEGKEEAPACPQGSLYHHSHWDMALLWGTAWVFTLSVFLVSYYFPEDWEDNKVLKRVAEDLKGTLNMCFSWSCFFGCQMFLAGMFPHVFEGQTELLSVVLALVLSFGVFSLLIGLDWLADQEWTDEACDKAIRATMDACSIIVGFAWEQCFDSSVDALAIGMKIVNPHLAKLLLSFFCAGLLVPAWKWYMLPFIQTQGWRFHFAMRVPEDLEELFDTVVERERCELATSKSAASEAQTLKLLHTLSTKHLGVSPSLGYVPPKEPEKIVIPDTDDPAILKQQIAELQGAVSRAEKDRDAAQKLVSTQLQVVLDNMKKHNLTVTRIP